MGAGAGEKNRLRENKQPGQGKAGFFREGPENSFCTEGVQAWVVTGNGKRGGFIWRAGERGPFSPGGRFFGGPKMGLNPGGRGGARGRLFRGSSLPKTLGRGGGGGPRARGLPLRFAELPGPARGGGFERPNLEIGPGKAGRWKKLSVHGPGNKGGPRYRRRPECEAQGFFPKKLTEGGGGGGGGRGGAGGISPGGL